MGGSSAVYVHQDQLPDSASRNRQIALSVPAIGGVLVYANSVRPFRQVHIKKTSTYVRTLDGITTLTVNSPSMIEVADLLSGILRHWDDVIIVSILLVFNAAVGFWQEHTAADAVAALKRQLALGATVRRDAAGARSMPPS